MALATSSSSSSTIIPTHIRRQFTLSDQALNQELVKMTDWFTDELFGGLNDATDIVFPASHYLMKRIARWSDPMFVSKAYKGNFGTAQ